VEVDQREPPATTKVDAGALPLGAEEHRADRVDQAAVRGEGAGMTEPSLLSPWAVCGIAPAAARFVPVPLLDDV
jgi:hypothetical protein